MVHLGVTTVDTTDCVPIFRSHRLCLSTRELRTEQGRELLVQDFGPYKRLTLPGTLLLSIFILMDKELCLLRDPMLNVAFEFLPDSLEGRNFPIQSVYDFRRWLS